MKKLDEIMELMADEMADFKKTILQLQLLSRQLTELSIPISTDALEKNLNAFLKKQELESQGRDELLKNIDKKLKNARIIPNYLLVIFGTLVVLAMGLVGYFIYTAHVQQEESFKIYRMILESESQMQQNFLAEHPEIKEAYFQWLEGRK